MDPFDKLHLRHPRDVLELLDRTDHTKQEQQKHQHPLIPQRKNAFRSPPFVVLAPAAARVVSVLCN